MKHFFIYGGLPVLVMVSMTGCIDNDYDLSDIDTTSEFKVTDLIIPVNIESVTLDDIFDIKEGDQIKEVTLNNETFYAVRESGTFASDPVNIPSFSTDAPHISPAALSFSLPSAANLPAKSSSAGTVSLKLDNPVKKQVAYKAEAIDASILEITELFTDRFHISLTFSADPEVSSIASLELSDLMLELPKGLNVESILPGGTYNDGRLMIPSVELENGIATITLTASRINLQENGCSLDNKTHSLTLDTEVNIETASLNVSPGSDAAIAMPDHVSLDVEYGLTPLDVNAVSGKIRYLLEGDALNIDPISLSEIPDFLAQEGTDLILNNPQIYLSVNNPVADEKLKYRTGLELTAYRENQSAESFSLDNGYFDIDCNKGTYGPYNFCLSPKIASATPEGYSNPVHVPFSSLENILSGNGIPQSIGIELTEPQIYEQQVEGFQLGRNLNALEGNWEFLAPLALKNGSGSRIIYTKTKNGWNDEDVDAITIYTLELSMTVDSSLPLSAHISGYPLDKNGNRIPGVTITGADIPANAKDYAVTVRVDGTVTHLDGITFTATVEPESDTPLAPSQALTLNNIRIKVSGNYIKEL